MAARLREKYKQEIAPALMKKFSYKSVMQIPKLDKVIVNVGCGESKNNSKEIEAICRDVATITGQNPITTKARKSVANFKVREGETVGVKVTLRGDKMWEFLDRLFIRQPRKQNATLQTAEYFTLSAIMANSA
ncbi:MAG: 50S ribosomal protein L5 [Pyramidobacter sp.]|nr:50S ribosomal protein L5 [Pyramidobacter sp.]